MDERKRLAKNGRRRLEKEVDREQRRFDRIAVDGAKQREQMAEFNRKYLDMQWDMASFTNDHEMWLAMQDTDRRTRVQRIQSQIFQQRAVFECFDQLRGGLSADNVIACVGMYVGLSLVNPEIRKTSQKMYAKALDGAIEFMEGHPDSHVPGMHGPMIDKFKEKRDKYLRAANDGRLPFTAETAALASIRLDMECYEMMRDGAHSVEEVSERHARAVDTLEGVCRFDDVDMADMARAKRIILAKAVSETETTPEGERRTDRARKAERVYSEFDVAGGWQKAAPHTERVLVRDDDGRVSMTDKNVWTGEYQRVGEDGYTPVDIDPRESPTVRTPYSKDDIAKNVSAVMCEYGKAYDFEDPSTTREFNVLQSLARSCRNTNVIGESVIDDVFGRGGHPVDFDALSDKPEDRATLEAVSANLRDVFERADEDFRRRGASDADMRGDMSAALHLGVLRGTVADTLGRSFLSYDSDDVKTDDERILTRRPVEMSCLASEYVRRCEGIDPNDSDFEKGTLMMASHYAAMCVADAVGIDPVTDKSSPEAKAKFDEAMSNPRAKDMANRVMREMCAMTHVYASAYSGALAAGNSPDEAMKAMTDGFKDAASPHAHAFDYAWPDGPDGERATYIRTVRSTMTDDAVDWSRDAASALFGRDDFESVFKDMADTRYKERAERRALLVNSKFSVGPDYGDGPSYDGEYR